MVHRLFFFLSSFTSVNSDIIDIHRFERGNGHSPGPFYLHAPP